MRISQLDYNNYVGIIGIGRIQRGKVTHEHAGRGRSTAKARSARARSLQVLGFMGLERREVPEAAKPATSSRSRGIESLEHFRHGLRRWTRPKRCRR